MSEKIPDGWKKVKLGELINSGYCKILNNKREPLAKMQREQMKKGFLYPYYGAAGIIDFINQYKFDGFYLLVAEDGTVTSNGINPMLQLVEGKFWVSNHAHVLQCKKEWQTKMLFYLLKNVDINPYITGAVQPKLSKFNLFLIEFYLPPLPEQKAIASVLSSLDDKIDLLHRQNKTLEQMAETLFRQWFIEEAKEDWKDKPLGEVVNIKYGKNLLTSKLCEIGYPVFGGNGQIGFYKAYMYKKPQVLISCRGAASGKVIISSPYSFVTNNSLILEIPEGSILNFEFLKYYALTTDFSMYVSGSAQPQITINDITNAELILPTDKNIIKRFSEIVRPIEQKILDNQRQICTLEKLRDTLLPKLMSGKVRVKY